MRDIIILACSKCKMRNYTTKKNKRLHPDRVEFKKFCRALQLAHGAQGDPLVAESPAPRRRGAVRLRGRGVAQLVEHRSPKPRVAGSNPAAPAITTATPRR